ncbi:hypothetical protein [Streptomyces sp. NPDC056544]|uniref:hypothetical protein n=1 Tax=unclassified Streptomyces TaxID=2593676 RepID=UPI0036CCD85C
MQALITSVCSAVEVQSRDAKPASMRGSLMFTGHCSTEPALRDMRNHLHFVVELDWFGRSEDWPGYHEVLRRIIVAGGPEVQEAPGPAGAAL